MKHLYRSRDNRMIGGVSGGLAEYFDVDVVVIRLLWVLSIFFAGGGFLAYLIAWILIPEKPLDSGGIIYGTEPEVEVLDSDQEAKSADQRRTTGGIILIGLGVIFLLHQLAPFHFARFLWPLLLIGLGIFIFAHDRGGKK